MLTWPVSKIKTHFKENKVPVPPNLTNKLDLATSFVTTMAARRIQGKREPSTTKKKTHPKKTQQNKKRKAMDLTGFSAADKRTLLAQLLEDEEREKDTGLGLGSPPNAKKGSKTSATSKRRKVKFAKNTTSRNREGAKSDGGGSGDDGGSGDEWDFDNAGESDEGDQLTGDDDDEGEPHIEQPLSGNEAKAKQFLLNEISSAVKVAVDRAMRDQRGSSDSQQQGRRQGNNPGNFHIFASTNVGGGGGELPEGGIPGYGGGNHQGSVPNFGSEAWRRIPGGRTDAEAIEAYGNLYDVAKRAIYGGLPVPLQAWSKLTHNDRMTSQLNQLDTNSDIFSFSSRGSLRSTKKSISPPKLGNWDDLWNAFDNRARFICVFRPVLAVHTVMDRKTISKLQQTGVDFHEALRWIDKALAHSGTPYGKMGKLDIDVMLELVKATMAPPPYPRPMRATPTPRGKPNRNSPNPQRDRKRCIRELLTKHRSHIITEEICFAYNRGTCNEANSHRDPKDAAKQRKHLCAICGAEHPLIECPDAKLPP